MVGFEPLIDIKKRMQKEHNADNEYDENLPAAPSGVVHAGHTRDYQLGLLWFMYSL